MIGALMLDIAGTSLTQEDVVLLNQPEVGGVILFSRNIESPAQVRTLTDSIRSIRSDLLIAVDQEGGRVRRLREGFSPIPAMGELGSFFEYKPSAALKLAQSCGALMASEVLAVGIDMSFAPVLDINGVSQVISDRGFHTSVKGVSVLAQAFMQGMKSVGMATTGKHFPGHGSCAPDSHLAKAVDNRAFADIQAQDLKPFVDNLHLLDALMPAHVIYPKVDNQPAGFSAIWLKDILRSELGFTGAVFTDDLSMKAAQAAGTIGDRVQAAITAGCDMVLVCNNRNHAKVAIQALKQLPKPNQARLERMQGNIPPWRGTVEATNIEAGTAKDKKATLKALASLAHQHSANTHDPTQYAG